MLTYNGYCKTLVLPAWLELMKINVKLTPNKQLRAILDKVIMTFDLDYIYTMSYSYVLKNGFNVRGNKIKYCFKRVLDVLQDDLNTHNRLFPDNKIINPLG